MSIKLRNWMEDRFFSFYRKPVERLNAVRRSRDYPELLVQLATTDDLTTTLPSVLKCLQQDLDGIFLGTEACEICILTSPSPGSNTTIFQTVDSCLEPRLQQRLHDLFALGQSPRQEQFHIDTDGNRYHVLRSTLLEADGFYAWALYIFPQKRPNLEKIRWYTSSIDNALQRGFQAWHQCEQRTREALQSERAIYAAELHDSIAQVLGYLRIQSSRLNKKCQGDVYAELQPMTQDLALQTQNAYRQTRELITSARLALQSNDFGQGIINSIKEFEQQSAIVFELDNRIPTTLIDAKQSMQILYIVRESLSNIVRHSHATHARVILQQKQCDLHIIIEDNGTGLCPNASRPDSFGTQIMQERAARIRGKLSLCNRPQGGTRVELVCPRGR